MAAAGLPRGMWNVESLVATCELFRDLVPRPGLELGPPAVGVRSLSHPTTREVPYSANFLIQTVQILAPGSSVAKNPLGSAGYVGLIAGSGRSPGEGSDSPLQYSCLGNPVDGRTWQVTTHGVAKVRHRLSN